MNVKAIWQYILARGQEPTTWRGLILIATALGAKLNPVHVEAIVTAGLFLAGIVAVSVPDKPTLPKKPPADDGSDSGV
jgi:hypothetical protein